MLIEDGGILVLGGLMSDTVSESEDRVPVLGAIPLIGNLFKSRSGSRQKKNLLVFIRPKILRDSQSTEETSEAKYNEMRQDERSLNHGKITLLPGEKQPAIPSIPPKIMAPAAPPPSQVNPEGAIAPQSGSATPAAPAQPAPAPPAGGSHGQAMSAELQEDRAQRKLSFPFAKRHGVLIRGVVNDVAETVCRPGVTPQALAEVRRFVGVPLKLERVSVETPSIRCCASPTRPGSGAAMQMLEGLDDNTDLAHLAEDIPESSDLLESDDEAPIIRLINALLTQAVKENASDIHIEPYENRLVIRFRVDGVLREVLQTKRAVAPLVVSRIKVMSKLDIAERRLPQDGSISLRIAGRAVDVRVSTLPSGHGERVVLRLLDKQAGRIELTALGMDPAHAGD